MPLVSFLRVARPLPPLQGDRSGCFIRRWNWPRLRIAILGRLADPDPGWAWVDCAAWVDLADAGLDRLDRLPAARCADLAAAAGGAGADVVWDPDALTDHCLAAVWVSVVSGPCVGYRRLRGRDGLGGGDAKLIAAAGAWCGLAALPLVVLGSALIGLLAALGLALTAEA